MTRFLVSIFHFLVVVLAFVIILFLTLGFYLSPEILIFFEPAGLSEDGRKLFGALFGFFVGVLIVVVFFGTLLVSLEINKNIRKIFQILERKNKEEIPISKNKIPPEI